MRVWHKPVKISPDNTTREIRGPGDLQGVKDGTLIISGLPPEGGPWIVAIGYAVVNGCSVSRS